MASSTSAFTMPARNADPSSPAIITGYVTTASFTRAVSKRNPNGKLPRAGFGQPEHSLMEVVRSASAPQCGVLEWMAPFARTRER